MTWPLVFLGLCASAAVLLYALTHINPIEADEDEHEQRLTGLPT